MNNSKLFSDEAANIYERAIGTLLKKNMLLYFSFGDYEEVIVQPSDQFSISFFFPHEGRRQPRVHSRAHKFSFRQQSRMKYDKVHNIYNKLLAIEDIDPTLVYIQYMKFARRAEGIKSGRTIFKKAREDPRTRHHVYVTAALMEYYCSKVRARQEPQQQRSDLAVGIQSSLNVNLSHPLPPPLSYTHRTNQWPSRFLSWG